MCDFLSVFIVFLILSCQSKTKENIVDSFEMSFSELSESFKLPAVEYRLKTWFHLNENNINKEGLTLDLEAIKETSLQEVQLF